MENTIKEIYERGFGTAYETYKSAVKVDNSIKLQDVKEYLNSREDKQTHFKYKNIIVLLVLVLITNMKWI